MENFKFKSFLVSKVNDDFKNEVIQKNINSLPKGDTLIKVKYSSLNYKDVLSSIGNKGVTKNYPHTPGIDASGIIVKSENENYKKGDKVIITGFDLGMNTSGGFQEYIRVPSSWIIKLPKNLSLKESMIYGTAGFTAALSVEKLISSNVKPKDGDILVTGATGGVGSIAISILNKLGYSVIGATGKLEEKDFILNLGAKDIIDRSLLNENKKSPLLKSKWAGVIDTVGGSILSNAIKSTKYGGCITCCGNVASHKFDTTVYPFILRGVSLLGIDSVQCPINLRQSIWNNLASKWKTEFTNNINEISLSDLDKNINLMLKGNHKGRTIINLNL